MSVKPCPRCGAAGESPCITVTGRSAKAWHKVRTLVTRSPRELEEAVLAATSASWLTEADLPAISAAATLARSIDDAVWKAELDAQRAQTALFEDHATTPALADDTGSLGYPIQVLIQILDRLGLTPAGRHNLSLDPEETDADDLARVLELHA